MRPRQQRSVVVFPAPFGPSRPKHSPRRIANDRPRTTSFAPYDLRSPSTRSTTSALGAERAPGSGAGCTAGCAASGTRSHRVPVPHAGDRALQLEQPAVEEVPAAGKHDDGQLLRPRPREHLRQRHDVVLLAVDDDRVGGHRGSPSAARRAPRARGVARRPIAPPSSARTRRTRIRRGRPAARRRPRRSATARSASAASASAASPSPSSNDAFRLPDAAEVEADGGVAQRVERLRERLRHLVVERAALQRMRVGDERDAARRVLGDVLRDLEGARRAGDRAALGRPRRQMRSLSTISPPTMCRSMISSMSARST